MDAVNAANVARFRQKRGGSTIQTAAIQGAGVSATGNSSTQGTYTYKFSDNGDDIGIHDWDHKSIVTAPDGNKTSAFSNFGGEVMLSEFADTVDANAALHGKKWDTFNGFDDQGRLNLVAEPSAVPGYTASDPTLETFNLSTGAYGHLNAGAGLIGITDYYTSGAVGYVKDTALKHGGTATAVKQSDLAYATHTSGGATIHPVSTDTVYQKDDGSNPEATAYSYSFSGDHISSVTATPPSVSDETGTEPGYTVTDFDSFGRMSHSYDLDGFETSYTYDDATGAVTGTDQQIGGGKPDITTTTAVDALGRPSDYTDGKSKVTHHVYADSATDHTVTTTPPPLSGPASVTDDNWATGVITDSTMVGSTTLSKTVSKTDLSGQTYESDQYYDIPGSHFNQTTFAYDGTHDTSTTTSPTTVARTQDDALGRTYEELAGASVGSLSLTAKDLYDTNAVGDGDLTEATDYPSDGQPAQTSDMTYDWRDRQATETTPNQLKTITTLDNLNETIEQKTADAGLSLSHIVSDVQSAFDLLGRAYQSITGIFNSAGSQTATKTDTSSFDGNGNDTIDDSATGAGTSKVYDDSDRLLKTFTTDSSGDIIEETKNLYDANDNVVETVTIQIPEAGATVALSGIDPQTYNVPASDGRVSATVNWYDDSNRLIESANFGDAGESGDPYSLNSADDIVHSGSVVADGSPVSRGTSWALVNSETYNDALRQTIQTDNAGHATLTDYRADGQVLDTIGNYVSGGTGLDQNQETEFAYAASGQRIKQIADNRTSGGVSQQVTQYVYNNPLNPSQPTDVIYPDSTDTVSFSSSTGAATISGSDHVHYSFDQKGRTLTATDQRGVVHTYAYDAGGRMTSDAVTTLPSGVTSPVRRIVYAFDDQNQLTTVTSYDAATGGSIVSQIAYNYTDSVNQLDYTQQSHSGAVGGTTPAVTYGYNDGSSANGVNLASITMPNGREIDYNYLGSGTSGVTGDGTDRLNTISDATGTLTTYSYLGASQIVGETFNQVSSGMALNLGDLDLFGWNKSITYTLGSSTLDGYGYNFDANHNITSRANQTAPSSKHLDQAYQYDGLDRLTRTNSGNLSGGTITNGAATSYQSFAMDGVGNFSSVNNNGTTTTRTSTTANEIHSINGSTTATGYDLDGNLTKDANGNTYAYDAWGHLITVKDSSSATIATYAYDGLGRRISKTTGGHTYDYYYNENWQIVQINKDGTVNQQFVWDPRYVNAPIELTQFNSSGAVTGSYFYMQDANFNVTGLVDASGTVVEHYAYDAYGNVTIYNGSWSANRTSSAYGNPFLYQGMQFDAETGLYQARNRYYSPALQVWITRDPAGYVDGASLHQFVKNNPAGTRDASGLAGSVENENCMTHAVGMQFFPTDAALKAGVIRLWRYKKWAADANQEFKDYYNNPTLMRDVVDAYFRARGLTSSKPSLNPNCGCNPATQRVVCLYIYSRWWDSETPYDMHWIVQHTDGTWSGKPGVSGPAESTHPVAQVNDGKKLVGCWILNLPSPPPLPPPPKTIIDWQDIGDVGRI